LAEDVRLARGDAAADVAVAEPPALLAVTATRNE
jgi:hypothetical protein